MSSYTHFCDWVLMEELIISWTNPTNITETIEEGHLIWGGKQNNGAIKLWYRFICFTSKWIVWWVTSLACPCFKYSKYWKNTVLSKFWKHGFLCRIWGSHNGGYEEYYLLGYNAMYSVESQPMFRRDMSPPSWGPKYKQSKKAAWKQVESRAICSFETSVDYTALYPRR
jgi:hypothetical protein